MAAQINQTTLRGAHKRNWKLAVADQKPVRPRTGWLYLAIALIDEAAGEPSHTPLAMGIVSGGGRLVMPWFELRIYPAVTMADDSLLDARAAGLEAALINLIGELIPPGGHLMIEYESPGQNQTHAELLLRVPPIASHLGSLMFNAGFRGEFKDWYISEGGHEGPRKLQANKSPNATAAAAARRNHRRDLEAFLKRPLPADAGDARVVRQAQARARKLLTTLRRASL
jgi:hypothetical protein